jgi:hypothetical protein
MTNINFENMNENMNKMSQSVYSAAKAFYAINTNICEQLIEQQTAMATLGIINESKEGVSAWVEDVTKEAAASSH